MGPPLSARISRHTSMPSFPGSMRSSRTKSGDDSRNAAKARSPRSQNTGSKPPARKTMPIISANAVSSSITRTGPYMSSSWHDGGRYGYHLRQSGGKNREVQMPPDDPSQE